MENKKSEEDRIMNLCARYHKCSSCPMNRKCEEELKNDNKIVKQNTS